MQHPFRPLLLVTVCLAAAAAAAGLVDGQVTGTAQIPAVVGSPSEGALALHGARLFVCPAGEGPGIARFCGDGAFSFVAPPGDYWALLEPAEPYRRGQVLEGLRIGVGELRWDPELAPDYNCTFRTMTEWHKDPWAWGTVFEQEFLARGTSITRAAFKIAGVNADATMRVSIHRQADREPVGPAQFVAAKAIDDRWVTWPAGAVPTTPGERYVLRLADAAEKVPVGLFVRRDHGWGYPFGELYVDGEPNHSDGYFYIGSEGDGAMFTSNPVSAEPQPLGPPAAEWTWPFTPAGTSLAAVALRLHAEGNVSEVTVEVRQDGRRRGSAKRIAPVRADDGSLHVGVACPRDEVPLVPGGPHALIVSCRPGETFAPLAGADGAWDLRLYEYQPAAATFQLPPPPERVPDPNQETLSLENAGFETGTAEHWETAWGGTPGPQAVGADWRPELFSGEAKAPAEGEYCGAFLADRTEIKSLVRRWSFWSYPDDSGLIHAHVWVASADDAPDNPDALSVRLCVSDHGSADAGGVVWSEPMRSPGKWTLLVSPPVVPKSGKLSVFLLVEGGNARSVSAVKIDGLALVVDER